MERGVRRNSWGYGDLPLVLHGVPPDLWRRMARTTRLSAFVRELGARQADLATFKREQGELRTFVRVYDAVHAARKNPQRRVKRETGMRIRAARFEDYIATHSDEELIAELTRTVNLHLKVYTSAWLKADGTFEPVAQHHLGVIWLQCAAAVRGLIHEQPEIPCPQCGASFVPPRRDARFCSARCRVAHHRATR